MPEVRWDWGQALIIRPSQLSITLDCGRRGHEYWTQSMSRILDCGAGVGGSVGRWRWCQLWEPLKWKAPRVAGLSLHYGFCAELRSSKSRCESAKRQADCWT